MSVFSSMGGVRIWGSLKGRGEKEASRSHLSRWWDLWIFVHPPPHELPAEAPRPLPAPGWGGGPGERSVDCVFPLLPR